MFEDRKRSMVLGALAVGALGMGVYFGGFGGTSEVGKNAPAAVAIRKPRSEVAPHRVPAKVERDDEAEVRETERRERIDEDDKSTIRRDKERRNARPKPSKIGNVG